MSAVTITTKWLDAVHKHCAGAAAVPAATTGTLVCDSLFTGSSNCILENTALAAYRKLQSFQEG